MGKSKETFLEQQEEEANREREQTEQHEIDMLLYMNGYNDDKKKYGSLHPSHIAQLIHPLT